MSDKTMSTILLILMFLIGVIYFASCPDKQDKFDKNIEKAFIQKEKELKDSIELLNGRISNRDAVIKDLKNQITEVSVKKKSVPYEKTKQEIHEAKLQKDTPKIISLCNTLQKQFDEYKRLDVIEEEKTSKAFKEYDEQIEDFKKQVDNNKALYENEKTKNGLLESTIKQKDKKIKKLVNKSRRERIIVIAVLIAGGILLK